MINFIQIFADHGGIRDDVPVIHNRRDNGLRIKLEICGIELIAGRDIKITPVPRDVFSARRRRTFAAQTDDPL